MPKIYPSCFSIICWTSFSMLYNCHGYLHLKISKIKLFERVYWLRFVILTSRIPLYLLKRHCNVKWPNVLVILTTLRFYYDVKKAIHFLSEFKSMWNTITRSAFHTTIYQTLFQEMSYIHRQWLDYLQKTSAHQI